METKAEISMTHEGGMRPRKVMNVFISFIDETILMSKLSSPVTQQTLKVKTTSILR